MRCVIHGSFRKHFDEVKKTYAAFASAGIEVLAPKDSEVAGLKDGFALFEGEEGMDPRMIELVYLQHLKRLGKGDGFSYFVCPGRLHRQERLVRARHSPGHQRAVLLLRDA